MKTRSPSIAIVGAGKLGTALAISLSKAGYRVTEIVARDTASSRRRAQALAKQLGASITNAKEGLKADVVWLCVPDSEIVSCARSLSRMDWHGKVVLHSSGALTSDRLTSLRRRGARVASVHPMMTFVTGVMPSLRGVGFAIEGDRPAVRAAREIVKRLGGESFLIAKEDKALYHAWGTFASPLLTALLAAAEQVARQARVPRGRERSWMLPIVRQTVENFANHGPARGFSGPIVRGDAETLAKHLKQLRRVSGAADIYRALARFAAQTLPAKNKALLLKVLR